MKQCNIPYCKEIPENWREIPNRYLFDYHSSKVGERWRDHQLLSLTTNGVKGKDINAGGGKVPDSYDKYQTVEPGDMVFCLFDLDVSAVFSGLSHHHGMITSAYDVVRPNDDLLYQGFSDYWFHYVFSNRYYKMYSKNIRFTITSEMFKSIMTPIPPIAIQKKIATFLDKKSAEIDALIEVENKQIEKLKEYKQAVITEAVTKGLDKSAPMKDSGIDWIGEIPQSWGTPKLKMICELSSGGTPSRSHSEYWNGDINWVKTGELQNNEIFDTEEKITTLGLVNSSAKLFPVNTILMALYGQGKTRGMTGLLKVACATNQACVGIVVKEGKKHLIDIGFLWKSLIGAYGGIRKRALGSGQPNLSGELVANFEIPLPPIEIQRKIVSILDEKCAVIDVLIGIKKQKIEKLNEYKKSLIYEYVTGKKEVE